MANLRIFYDGNSFITCDCSRWDEGNWDITLQSFMGSGNRDILFANVVPGAYRELYNILGTPKYIDTTYTSGNSLRISPLGNTGLSSLREERIIAVKNISDNFITRDYFNVKIEAVRLDT